MHKITIIPHTRALGYTMQLAEKCAADEEDFNRITTYTGGRAAEELVLVPLPRGNVLNRHKTGRAMVYSGRAKTLI